MASTAQVIPFKFDARDVRTMLVDDQPWFVAADVASALQYLTAKDMARNLDEDEKGRQILPTPGGEQEMLVINESGLYSAILRSRKTEAKRFKKWVTSEVLPAIRRSGRYEDAGNKMATLVDELIGMTEVHVIKGLIRDKAKVVLLDKRRSFQQTMHNRLHTRFNVPRVELIPAQQFEAACNFIAAYALEGEWLEAERPELNIHFPVEELAKRRPEMLTKINGESAWLDVTLHDLRDLRGMPTPCESILGELDSKGYEIAGAWWELRTYRNKLYCLENQVRTMLAHIQDPHRYAVSRGGKI